MTGLIGVAGDLVEDVIIWASGPIAHGTDTPSRIFRVRGGSAANVAHAVAAKGGTARLLTRVGADHVGEGLVSELRSAGVDVRAQLGETSDTIVVLIDEHGERTMLPDRSNARAIEPFDPAWIDGLAWLHVPLYGFETPPETAVFSALCDEATRRGVPVSIDVSSLGLIELLGPDHVHELLAQLRPRVLLANDEEARALWLHDRTPPEGSTWVLKRGADPIIVRTDTAKFAIEVPLVAEVVDTTGAGDRFAAGLLRGLVDGADFKAATRLGIATAREVLRTPGAHTH